MNTEYKINKYFSKLVNAKNTKKRYLYQKKYIQHIGGANKEDVCSNNKFNNDNIIIEIYFNNLLTELHTLIINSDKTQAVINYEEHYNKLNRILLNILDIIKTKTTDFNIDLPTLISHYYINKNLPPKIIHYISDIEKKEIIKDIKEYQNKILNIDNIGYMMCSLLYDTYINKNKPDNKNKHDDQNLKADLLKYILKESIKHFDNDDNIKDNFVFFHKTFSNTFKDVSIKLNTDYLERSNSCYLVLVKNKNKIRFMSDIDDNLKNHIYNLFLDFYNNNDEKLINIKKENEEYENRIVNFNDIINKNENTINSYNVNLNELKNKINKSGEENNKTLFSNKELIELTKNNIEKIINLIKDITQINIEYQGYIANYQQLIDNNKKTQNTIYEEIKTELTLQFFINNEDFKNYSSLLNESVLSKRNVLVPILLFDITKDNTKINNISEYIKNNKDFGLKFKLHSNMLFINNKQKYIEHFEPHGVSGLYDSTAVFNILKEIHQKIPDFHNYTFYKQADTCPIIEGPQILDRSDYCYIHSGYYSFLRILYPDISSEEIQMMLISKLNPDFNDETYVKTTLSDYLNKKYERLFGYNIKTRLENFMSWYKSVIVVSLYPNMNIQYEYSKIIKQIMLTPTQIS